MSVNGLKIKYPIVYAYYGTARNGRNAVPMIRVMYGPRTVVICRHDRLPPGVIDPGTGIGQPVQ